MFSSRDADSRGIRAAGRVSAAQESVKVASGEDVTTTETTIIITIITAGTETLVRAAAAAMGRAARGTPRAAGDAAIPRTGFAAAWARTVSAITIPTAAAPESVSLTTRATNSAKGAGEISGTGSAGGTGTIRSSLSRLHQGRANRPAPRCAIQVLPGILHSRYSRVSTVTGVAIAARSE